MAFNWGLARVKANLAQREAEKSYEISVEDLTPILSWSLYSLRKEWNLVKDTVAPWWRECSKEAFNTGLDQLARALKNWRDSRRGKRRGKPAGFPRFRSKRRGTLSIRFTTGALRCESRHAVLPRVGRVKLHENGDRLVNLVIAGQARVIGASVRFERGRWFSAFTVEQDLRRPCPREPDAVVGVDLGIKTLAVLSTGEEYPNPRHLDRSLRKIRRLGRTVSRRQGPGRIADTAASHRYRRAATALAKAQGRVADRRKDFLHKATTELTARFGTVVIEDLHVRGMLANRRLARRVADSSFAEFRRQVEYKAAWRGGRVIIADRWFPSSKTCSRCGAVKTKLTLRERQWACQTCGAVLERDNNAAVNLARLAGSGSDSNGRGANRQTGPALQVAMKRQPGKRSRPRTDRDRPAARLDCGMNVSVLSRNGHPR